jgi:hypothetical protein
VKTLQLSIFIFIISLSTSWATDKAFHLVFDIDYTLFHVVDKIVSKRTVRASDKLLYEPIAWGVEGIENSLARGYRISFYSGGEESRNLSLLKKIKLSDGRSLLEIAEGVYSKKDLEVVAEKGRFSERYKKNLKKLGFDLKRTLLIDDLENFIPSTQKNNVLWVGKTYHHFNSFDLAKKSILEAKKDLKYIPTTNDQWFISKNKMKYVFDLILDAKEKSRNSYEILSYIQKNKNKYIPYDEIITPNHATRLGPLDKPSLCFRNFRFFKVK